MNNKIIGFAILGRRIQKKDIDLFNSGLSFIEIKNDLGNIYIWGIGKLEKCFLSKSKFSMPFPLYKSLLDRNVIISFSNQKISIENDCLSSFPAFYTQN